MSSTILSEVPDTSNPPFDATLRVAGATIAPDNINPGGVVLAFGSDGERVLSLTEACALAAALQAVAVYQMESTEAVAA